MPDIFDPRPEKSDSYPATTVLSGPALWRRSWSFPERVNIRRTWPVLFFIVVGILFCRLPSAVVQANFYAEDSIVFFKQQYEQGFFPALFTHYGGYLHFMPRILAAICSMLPLPYAPQAFAVASLVVASVTLTFFFASGFRSVINHDLLRAGIVIIFTLMPNADSLMKLAYVNWFMVVFIVLVTIFTLPQGTVARWLFFIPVAAAVWSTPVAIVCLPVVGLRAWEAADRRERLWWLALALVIVAYAFTEERPPSLLPTLLHEPAGKWALVHALGYRVFHFFFAGEYLSYPWPDEGWKIMTLISCVLAAICAIGTILAVLRTSGSGSVRRVPLVLFYLILSTSAMFVLRTGGWHFFLDWNSDAWDANGRFFYCSTILLCVLWGVIYERVLRDWITAKAFRRATAILLLMGWLSLHQLGFKLHGWHSQVSWQQSTREILAAETRARKTGQSEIVHVQTALFGFDFDLNIKPN